MRENDFIAAIDLGQTTDPSALAILKRSIAPTPPTRPAYEIVHLRRFPLGTPYTAIVSAMLQLLDAPERPGSGVKPLRGCIFGLDQTGVGRPVVDMFRAAKPPCKLHPMTITAGHNATRDNGEWHVPKRDLVGAVQVLLQSRRMRWSTKLPHAEILDAELANFRATITASANEVFSAREGQHDDLLLAVAIAAWLGERIQPPSTSRPFSYGGMYLRP